MGFDGEIDGESEGLMKRIFVTGSEGFIGSHLVEELVQLGYRVKCLVLYNSFDSWGWLDHIDGGVKKELEVVLGDVRDGNGLWGHMKGSEGVIHLASLIGIPYSYEAVESYIDTNVKGTLNVMEAARGLGVSKVVHASTSEVYGTAEYVPMDEKHGLRGQSPYSASKIGADQLALSFYYSFGLPVGIIRPFNAYGPRQSERAIIPATIMQGLKGEGERIEIKLGLLSPTRDFNYVKDIVEGFVRGLEFEELIGEEVNIGSGYEISMEDLVGLIGELMGKEIGVKKEEERVRPVGSEVMRLLADFGKAKRLLGWEPKEGGLKGLRIGLKKTIRWFRQNMGHYDREDMYHR